MEVGLEMALLGLLHCRLVSSDLSKSVVVLEHPIWSSSGDHGYLGGIHLIICYIIRSIILLLILLLGLAVVTEHQIARLHYENRGVCALFGGYAVLRSLACSLLALVRHCLEVVVVALVQADLVAQQVLDLLALQVLPIVLREENGLVREALLLAEHDVSLLIGHYSLRGIPDVPCEAGLGAALAKLVRLAANGTMCILTCAGHASCDAVRKASRGHEGLLAALAIRANRRVELSIL